MNSPGGPFGEDLKAGVISATITRKQAIMKKRDPVVAHATPTAPYCGTSTRSSTRFSNTAVIDTAVTRLGFRKASRYIEHAIASMCPTVP